MKRILNIAGMALLIAAARWVAPGALASPNRDSEQSQATAEAKSGAATGAAAAQSGQSQLTPQPNSKKKPWYARRSAKIIGGGTGAGAIIGGLAGGGKGAAIGAISGGTAGYIYDRKTRRR